MTVVHIMCWIIIFFDKVPLKREHVKKRMMEIL